MADGRGERAGSPILADLSRYSSGEDATSTDSEERCLMETIAKMYHGDRFLGDGPQTPDHVADKSLTLVSRLLWAKAGLVNERNDT